MVINDQQYQELLNELLQINFKGFRNRATISAPLLTWVTVHGNLCLALRHPANTGESRKLALQFVKKLGEFLVTCEVFTQEQLTTVERVEVEEGSTDLGR